MWTALVICGVMTPPVLGSSPWSLLQAKTSMDGAVGAVSSMDEALTFVQDLAEKVVGHNVPLSKTEKSAVDTIQAYVKRMLDDIQKQRTQDQNEVNRYRQVIQSCADVAQDALQNGVSNTRSASDQARKKHAACRVKEQKQHAETAGVCLKYDSYRASADGAVPGCMNGLRSSDISSTDPATKKDMEQCITAINGWVVPLYELYIKCKNSKDVHLRETQGCDDDQASFEMAFCQYATLLAGTCDTQISCRKRNIETMEDGDKEVKVAEQARQADCEVGHKVDCLLKIFEETDNEKKPKMLEECKKLKPTCPEKIVYPPTPGPTPCKKSATEPCEDAWTEEEYNSQPWYGTAPTTACHACHPPHPCKVTLYEHNFAGWSASFPPGEYETRDLKRGGAKDDQVSSMKVEDGCIASVYAHPDFTGKASVFTAGSYKYGEFVKKFPNDLVSSMIVEPDSQTSKR